MPRHGYTPLRDWYLWNHVRNVLPAAKNAGRNEQSGDYQIPTDCGGALHSWSMWHHRSHQPRDPQKVQRRRQPGFLPPLSWELAFIYNKNPLEPDAASERLLRESEILRVISQSNPENVCHSLFSMRIYAEPSEIVGWLDGKEPTNYAECVVTAEKLWLTPVVNRMIRLGRGVDSGNRLVARNSCSLERKVEF